MLDSRNSSKSRPRRKFVLWAWALAVFIVLVIVALFAIQPDERVHPRVKESVLKIDLKTMREAIEKYTLDRQKPPRSLQDLVDANYLRAIPVDPMTNRRDWRVDFVDVALSPNLFVRAVRDVHSSSPRASPLDGTRYDTW